MPSMAARLGFDESKISFAIRTSITSCVALISAWLLGLDHPQWAAMSVWAASLPLREQALLKSGFRMAGTIVGTVAGVALVETAQAISPYAMVIGLAFWVGLCTWASNIQRGYLAYGTVLAGYTAAMVALLDPGTESTVLALGLDRLATVLTGVVLATLSSLAFAPRAASHAGLRTEVSKLLVDLLRDLALGMQGADSRGSTAKLLSQIAQIEEALETRLPTMAKTGRNTRAVLIAAVAVALQRQYRPQSAAEVAAHITAAAAALEACDRNQAYAKLREAAAALRDLRPGLREALENLADALQAWATSEGDLGQRKTAPSIAVVLHKDWVGAREAGLRAGFAITVVGLLWQISGWSAGNYMLLGLSIMISLFSSFENPARVMKSVIFGQLCAFAAVFLCRWLIWPLLENEAQLILAMLPFILASSLLVAHRSTTLIAMDYAMAFLLLMQPKWPLIGTPMETGLAAIGVIFGPIAASVLYRVIFPTDRGHRIETLRAMMQRDLADLATKGDAWENRTSWRARLYHRSLHLMRLLDQSPLRRTEALEQSLRILEDGHRIMQLHRLLAEGTLSPRAKRAAQIALARARQFTTNPEKARQSLAHWFAHHRPPAP